MNKCVLIFLFAVSLLMPSVTVYADVVMGNDFQWENKDETNKLERERFIVNGPTGYVIPQQRPGEANEGFTFERPWTGSDLDVVLPIFYNGSILFMDSTYVHDGEYWGVMRASHTYSWPGWVPMEHLLVEYTRHDFEEENQGRFYEFAGDVDTIFSAERIIFWQWPGSDREKRIFDDSGMVFNDVYVSRAYRDEEGREWGYLRINYSWVNLTYSWWTESWVCLTDPANSDIPSFNPSALPATWSPDGIFEWIHPDAPETFAERYSLSNIIRIRTYEPGITFTDISENAWYKDAVAAAYEYDIFSDAYNNMFYPSDSLTGWDALLIASQIHAYYKYGQEEGNRLIQLYYNVCPSFRGGLRGIFDFWEVEGLIDRDLLDDYNFLWKPITRAQMVHICAQILQPDDMREQNTVISLPDVNDDTPYSAHIFLFYEAGIIAGVDARGTFNPNSTITRAEAASIFVKLIDVTKRHSGRVYN